MNIINSLLDTMISKLRQNYNTNFTEAQYQNFLKCIDVDWPNQLEFRLAETPLFVPKSLKNKLIEACESFIDVIVKPDFKDRTKTAIPLGQNVPNENNHTSFLAIDFAVCKNETGELIPQLIELQGFPSIFGFQSYISEQFRKFFPIPETFNNYFGVQNQEAYIKKLKDVIVGNENPENVILLDIFPEKQKTKVDFAVTEAMIGVKAVCLTKIKKKDRKLFYEKDGREVEIKRIYNRLIFDDLTNFPNLKTDFNFTDDVDVVWVGHPNWFFRISKYILPFLESPYAPETHFLSDYKNGRIYLLILKNQLGCPTQTTSTSSVKLKSVLRFRSEERRVGKEC